MAIKFKIGRILTIQLICSEEDQVAKILLAQSQFFFQKLRK